jgi:hypothetical protein
LATQAYRAFSDLMRARGLRIAGVLIILLGVGAALLPAGKTMPSDMIGGLLIAGGLIELLAGSLRRESRSFAMAAGAVTAAAGLLFVLNPETHFFPSVWPIIGWVLLIAGLSISTIVISLFGPTRELIASFAWFLAASFAVNGLMLLQVASCEAEEAP